MDTTQDAAVVAHNVKRPLRIAIFAPYIFETVYGNTRYLGTIFKYLNRTRAEPILFAQANGGFLRDIEALGGQCDILPAPARLNQYGGAILAGGLAAKALTVGCLIWYSLRIARRFLSQRIDIVQCHDLRAVLTAGFAAKILRRRIIWYIKGELDNPLLDRIGFAMADRVLFQGETNMRRLYPELIRKHQNKISILRNGIDLDEVGAAESRDKSELIRELNFDKSKINIGFVGQIMRPKGLDELVTAMAEVQESHPDAALYIVGDHCADAYRGYQTELENLIRKLGLINVKFTGWRADAHDIISLMDIFVLPSHAEGVPKSVIEAMAMGKPVLTTRVGSIPDVVDHGETGILVPARNAKALAEKLARLLADKEFRRRLGQNARAKALNKHSIKDNIKGLERIYREMSGTATDARIT
jgi:glycosyltransferase involved in cell wall biosynthesis